MSTPASDLKLFIWEDVLCDYTCGMIVALAPDLETAISVCSDKYGTGYYPEEMAKPFKTISLAGQVQADVWAVHGGG